MIRRSDSEAVGGLDPRLATSYDDVDLCLKLTQAGRRIVYQPAASLIHHESCRGAPEVSPCEVYTLQRRWGERLRRDPRIPRAWSAWPSRPTSSSGMATT